MKFLGTTNGPAKTNTTIDGVEDPNILTSQIANTKPTWRGKKYNQVRISEIGTFCPREYALGYKTETKAENFIQPALEHIFDLGSALHYWLQNKSKRFKKTLHGYWYCMACRTYRMNADGTKYFGPRPNSKCESCVAHKEATIYSEYMFRLTKPYRIVGKVDGVIEKEGVYRFVDFKSYDTKKEFPLEKDVAQLSAYMYFYKHIPEEDKLPVPIDTTKGYLIYVGKSFSYKDYLLTYTINKDEKLISAIKNNVAQFTDCVDKGKSIPKPLDCCIKNKWEKGRAKNCYMKDVCKRYYTEKGV